MSADNVEMRCINLLLSSTAFTHFTSSITYNQWVIPEKIHTLSTDGKLEILAGGGGGGVDSSGNPGELKNSSLGVTFNFNKSSSSPTDP